MECGGQQGELSLPSTLVHCQDPTGTEGPLQVDAIPGGGRVLPPPLPSLQSAADDRLSQLSQREATTL